jgi:SWI/SNF-related matrix-associated actin-dependent regulator of chromatin subfamily A member 5
VIVLDDDDEAPPKMPANLTQREVVRYDIEHTTTARRKAFLMDNIDLFQPLLPSHNYISKLVAEEEAATHKNKRRHTEVVPYDEIKTQPRGIKATMKPYQLSGLSFLLYLHRNGLSGILGDEMGLGKTLQTLSLVQYLKENEPKSGQPRPFLIICPLSVLSSWVAEAKRWTPKLKVIRFHGPMTARDALKREIHGGRRAHGQLTTKQRSKLNPSRAASGIPVVDLVSDSEESEPESDDVDIVVTTYDCYKSEQGWFKRAFVWRYVVLDEGHNVKNSESEISQSLQGIKAEYRLILTGTPVQNNLTELWSLLHWLYPDVFTDKTSTLFSDSFDLTKGQVQNSVLDSARQLLELVMLRRMKNSPNVNLNLPPKTDVLLFVPLTPLQRFWYTRLITRMDQALLEEIFKAAKDKEASAMKAESEEDRVLRKQLEAAKQESVADDEDNWQGTKAIIEDTLQQEEAEAESKNPASGWRKLMNLVMQLRKVCNHPYTIQKPNIDEAGDHLKLASGKFVVLEKLITELVIKQKKKVLIFSGFISMLDLVGEFLYMLSKQETLFRTCRLDGSTVRARRNLSMRLFQDDKSLDRVMLISTRAGGLGINLTAATNVIFLDQDWNPQITLQAEARAHRIGQTQPVTIYRLISQGTVEEQMMGRIAKKLYLSAKVTESMRDIYSEGQKGGKKSRGGRKSEATEDMPQMSTGQLLNLVRRGTSALSHPEIDVTEMLKWDWETTLAKCKDQPHDVAVAKHLTEEARIDAESEQKWLNTMERVEGRIFEGKALERASKKGRPKNSDIMAEAYNRADRRVGKNTTVMVDGFAISKESMNCGDWEAVPTLAGKDPRLADLKRPKREAINHQAYCQVCKDGGELYLCNLCPRAYHFEHLDSTYQALTAGIHFNCPQHSCFECGKKTADAGGMLYRCRWCDRAACEDHLDFTKTELIGDALKEYDLLGYPEHTNAHYIQCQPCTHQLEVDPAERGIVAALAKDIDREWQVKFITPYQELTARIEETRTVGVEMEHATPSRDMSEVDFGTSVRDQSTAPSLSDAAITIETSGVSTPRTVVEVLKSKTSKRRSSSVDSRVSTRSSKRVRAK